jgi:hypothetical protein
LGNARAANHISRATTAITTGGGTRNSSELKALRR